MNRFLKIKLFVNSLLLMASCSHYGPPITIGQGVPTNQEIVSCTDYFLTFPHNPHNLRLDTVLRQNDLTDQDVYSVEQRAWFYLFPIYTNRCLIVTLNKSAVNRGRLGELIDEDAINVP